MGINQKDAFLKVKSVLLEKAIPTISANKVIVKKTIALKRCVKNKAPINNVAIVRYFSVESLDG